MAGIEDNKDKNIEMAETESLGDMEKPTAEDTLTEDKSEMTIQQLYQEFLADWIYNAQRIAEFDRNIKQSEARIDKICVGLITMQAEQKEAMNINNEQMGAISQQLQQSEDRIDHKASVRPMDKLTTTEEGDSVQFKSAFEQQGTFQQMASVVSELVDKRNKEVKIPAMDTSSKPKFDLNQYNASTPKIHNKLPALGLSPISSHEPSTAPTLLKANLVSENILETSSTDQGYQQMAYVSSYAHLPPTMSQSYLVQSSTPLQKQLTASGSYQVSPMLNAVPTNSTIPVESMANPPPPTFMTPIMTTSSAPGALTGLPQQQADSTDRSRKGQRKPKERGNSSSSDSSLEREYTRWQENSGARDRSRSPQLPKMQIFNGRGSITWEAFIYQFERTAGRRQWVNRKKVCRLLDCLADVALEYARKVNTDDDSKALRKALKQRFSKKDDQTRLEPKHSSEDIKTKILQGM
ncbi:unnamed protein product [Mytilus coruscus]|uniref:Uncharacterized protein n=1 Tax=Mytilus coruscus TaxID=42192 RepID=A0A6J8EI80_MYTCO|nr:unnamed protein product [Mytilus coruscus]